MYTTWKKTRRYSKLYWLFRSLKTFDLQQQQKRTKLSTLNFKKIKFISFIKNLRKK